MIDYTFQETTFTEELNFSYEPWLFHHRDHLLIQSPHWNTFSVFNKKQKTVNAHLHVNIQNTKAVSPFRAPFGSIQFLRTLKPLILYSFLEFVCAKLKEKGVTHLTLKNHPDAYETGASSLLNTFLINQGFQVETAEAGSVLTMDQDFVKGLRPWIFRKFRQLENTKLTFNKSNIDQLEYVFRFIQDCHRERNYLTSIDWSTLERTVKTFPGRFILFQIFSENETAAASISIDIGNKILYNFYMAHPLKFDSISPVVMLLKGMHQFCIDNNYRLLDLGTSALDGLPNFGLLDFKLGLGATPTMKLTFKKEL